MHSPFGWICIPRGVLFLVHFFPQIAGGLFLFAIASDRGTRTGVPDFDSLKKLSSSDKYWIGPIECGRMILKYFLNIYHQDEYFETHFKGAKLSLLRVQANRIISRSFHLTVWKKLDAESIKSIEIMNRWNGTCLNSNRLWLFSRP